LEPGTRECVALVIMPSFVPYVRLDTRTNWFKLSNPKCKLFDLQSSVQFGEEVSCLRELTATCQGNPCVRGTDMALLMRSVDQLERRLSLQTCLADVPFELTDSGHTIFNHGTSDLAPRLRGYYGEPGAKGKDFSVALVGEHFSVTDTQVIAGNLLLTPDQVNLLSRQVVLITIPAAAITDGNNIDVHVATPYGVSNHLNVILPKDAAAPTWTMKPQAATCTYTVAGDNPDMPGYYQCVSYTPAVVLQYSGTVATVPQSITVAFTFGDLDPFLVTATKVGDQYKIKVKDLGQQLLDALVTIDQVDPSAPPETNSYNLTPMSITANGTSVTIDGTLQLSFKPLATKKSP